MTASVPIPDPPADRPSGESLPACAPNEGVPEMVRIGDVARLLDTTPRTIRYYEEIGLLAPAPARHSGKHRLYSHEEVQRISEVMRLKHLLGVTLEELKTLLTAEDARAEVRAQLRRDDVGSERRRELLAEALGHIDRQLELVRHRAGELAKLENELSDSHKRVRRKIRELDARTTGSFPPPPPRATTAAQPQANAEPQPTAEPQP